MLYHHYTKPGWGMTDIYVRSGKHWVFLGFWHGLNAACFWGARLGESHQHLDLSSISRGDGNWCEYDQCIAAGFIARRGNISDPAWANHGSFWGNVPVPHKNAGRAGIWATSETMDASAESLPDDHPAWQLEAEYLAYGSPIFFHSPLDGSGWGAVMHQPGLLQKSAAQVFPSQCTSCAEILQQMDTTLCLPL